MKKQVNTFIRRPVKKRKGVHSKCRTSKSKRSRNYRKAYAGQGR